MLLKQEQINTLQKLDERMEAMEEDESEYRRRLLG
jgi:hypothetical protein